MSDLRALFGTGSRRGRPLAPSMIGCQLGRAVHLISTVALCANILGVSRFGTGSYMRGAVGIYGRMLLVFTHRTGRASVRVRAVKGIVIHILMSYLGNGLLSVSAANRAGKGFGPLCKAGRILGYHTVIPLVCNRCNGSTLGYRGSAIGANGVTRVAFCGTSGLGSIPQHGVCVFTRLCRSRCLLAVMVVGPGLGCYGIGCSGIGFG